MEGCSARHGGLDIAGEANLRDPAPLGILEMEDGEWTDIQTDVRHKSQDESIEMPHLLFSFISLVSLASDFPYSASSSPRFPSLVDCCLICLAFFSTPFSFK